MVDVVTLAALSKCRRGKSTRFVLPSVHQARFPLPCGTVPSLIVLPRRTLNGFGPEAATYQSTPTPTFANETRPDTDTVRSISSAFWVTPTDPSLLWTVRISNGSGPVVVTYHSAKPPTLMMLTGSEGGGTPTPTDSQHGKKLIGRVNPCRPSQAADTSPIRHTLERRALFLWSGK